MKLKNLNKVLVMLDGKPIKDANRELTVGLVLANMTAGGFEKVKPLEAVRLHQLAVRLYESKGELEVNADSVSLLKRVMEENRGGYTALVLGQALLESELEKE